MYGDNGYDFDCEAKEVYTMSKGINGTWIVEINGDFNGQFYNYLININGKISEVVDPYAKAVGVNGRKRSMVIDLESTNPRRMGVMIQKPRIKRC